MRAPWCRWYAAGCKLPLRIPCTPQASFAEEVTSSFVPVSRGSFRQPRSDALYLSCVQVLSQLEQWRSWGQVQGILTLVHQVREEGVRFRFKP